MKALVYSSRKNEREILSKANDGKHELSWQTAALSKDTVQLAAGQDAVVVFTNDDVSASVMNQLATLGVKYVITRSAGTDHIDFEAAARNGIRVSNIPAYSPNAIAEHAIALTLALSRHLIRANRNCMQYDFSLDHLTGFNLNGKQVGIVGMGHIGLITARIFQGFGCNVSGYDVNPDVSAPGIPQVPLNDLLQSCDIISLHVPLNRQTEHMINSETLSLMKKGAMLINTSRGGLVNTIDVLQALDAGRLGYYGTDVYEFERGIFFEDRESDTVRDALLTRLIAHPKVLLTPHQAFLTVEAISDITTQVIRLLDDYAVSVS
ncbi:2-hydroxyacid dehydrogenase [Pedobacter faecalis]|uniref:2-hydroxyacid dehydrogenase n=1 Tax=Pedobacter faecalis TaxID=3041495 RepID=UPI00254D1768|nr:2-hydroxyacid dehydrogenase [Pedobacter sp. ELA7]